MIIYSDNDAVRDRLDTELNPKMIGHCELNCTEGLDYCCICCPQKRRM